MNKIFLKRFKSFIWRLSMMVIVVLADYVAQNLLGFGLPAYATITVGLVAGEISKFFNTELSKTKPTVELSTVAPAKKVASKKKVK